MSGTADGQPVVLRELGGQYRTVELAGSDMPERGMEAPVSLRAVHSRYPGGKVTTQILGVEEGEITLKCRFNDRLTSLDEGAIAQSETLRSILLGQQPVELTWGILLTRRGYLTKVTPRYERESLIGCEIAFLPVEADEAFYVTTPMGAPSAKAVLDLLDLLDAILDASEEIVAVTNLVQAAA